MRITKVMVSLIKAAALIYPGWILVCLVIDWAGRTMSPQVAEYFSLGTGLVGMVVLTRVFGRYAGPEVAGNPPLRNACLGFWGLVFGAGYLGVAWGEINGPMLSAVLTANLIFFACVLGNWLGTAIKRPPELVPVCLVVALSDIVSLTAGPTRSFSQEITAYYGTGMEGLPPLVDFFLIKLPVPGMAVYAPVFGVTDWIILVLLSTAALVLKMDDNMLARRGTSAPSSGVFYVPAALPGLVCALLAARTLGIYLPALPFMSGFYLIWMMIFYPQVRRLTRAEIRPMVGVTVIMAVAAVFLLKFN